jgi:hypothetical protein
MSTYCQWARLGWGKCPENANAREEEQRGTSVESDIGTDEKTEILLICPQVYPGLR